MSHQSRVLEALISLEEKDHKKFHTTDEVLVELGDYWKSQRCTSYSEKNYTSNTLSCLRKKGLVI